MADKPSPLSIDDISILDKQVETLADFKPIPEHEVKLLCDKVSLEKDPRRLEANQIYGVGKGNSDKRIKRTARALPRDCLRRHPRPVPRSDRAVQDWRQVP